eukprot:TRINITY_DN84707_c0_g1_i1.p2 TRINITY_DN84707_c0_g1~~TRINITY_DN84707_c0_g1_i1.p2  ORF type:complete len:252 (+),score=32.27 TRINITY_DN84707_c0_g1_i1:170-925(+)
MDANTTMSFEAVMNYVTAFIQDVQDGHTRQVVFHRRQIFGPFAYHDWIQVGKDHYEIKGEGDAGGNENEIEVNETPRKPPMKGGSAGGCHWPYSPGYTQRSDEEIRVFNQTWLRVHPKYAIVGADCQTHARDFMNFLGLSCSGIPLRDGHFINGHGINTSIKGFVTIINRAGGCVTFSAYDKTDMFVLVSRSSHTLQPGYGTTLWATGGTDTESAEYIQMRASCVDEAFNLATGQTYAFDGANFNFEGSLQ